MKYRVDVNDKVYDVTVTSRAGNEITFSVNDESYRTRVTPYLDSSSSKQANSTSTGPSNGKIVAPMPGIVVQILVNTGDTVSAGQTVAVIEAMKMENNIVTGSDGVVTDIAVASGEEVDSGQLLLSVE